MTWRLHSVILEKIDENISQIGPWTHKASYCYCLKLNQLADNCTEVSRHYVEIGKWTRHFLFTSCMSGTFLLQSEIQTQEFQVNLEFTAAIFLIFQWSGGLNRKHFAPLVFRRSCYLVSFCFGVYRHRLHAWNANGFLPTLQWASPQITCWTSRRLRPMGM